MSFTAVRTDQLNGRWVFVTAMTKLLHLGLVLLAATDIPGSSTGSEGESTYSEPDPRVS